MIYEIRTYDVVPGSVAELEQRFGEAYEHRKKYSPLLALWHTEIGPLNQVVHIWPYADLAERARIRAEAAKDTHWPPKIQEFLLHMESEVVTPFGFLPELKPGKLGPIFEMRCYTMKAGTFPGLAKRWEAAIGERLKLSPIVLAGGVEFGEVSRFVHIWGYESLDQRMAVRTRAREAGIWPPPGGGGSLLTQANKILMPASFSPVH